ncbi:hypothetical protein PHJA_000444300 [Phtheirospermum japonicum]|uniref:Uncharacterized protein n=1 Tax=Phtheirospermum japonicum TaxID=374723 RepID=A0A830BAG2_9LAMI|nr:hypothetical protein PHJA_000444300 [Phtheirospermum japonicum]
MGRCFVPHMHGPPTQRRPSHLQLIRKGLPIVHMRYQLPAFKLLGSVQNPQRKRKPR